jgi:hypothetical protein
MTETGRASERPRPAGLRWHWLWFLPLCILVLAAPERHTVIHAYRVFALICKRWSWGVLISPSAVFCLAVIAVSVVWPLLGLGSIPFLVAGRKQASWVFLIIVAILLLPFVTDFLIWGSFPLIVDQEGFVRLRMIPFLPWPSGQLGEY